jgi:hypothetical protein
MAMNNTGTAVASVEQEKIRNVVPADLVGQVENVDDVVSDFLTAAVPFEAGEGISVFVDACTGARFCECHISAEKLIGLGTIDVPLDPDDQGDYRANREILADHAAFLAMKEDAKKRRAFSNIVAEFTTEFDEEHPIKIIGGQHRFEAIREALGCGINEYHGLKVYFGLDSSQRLDVQLVSNTVIAVSTDLYDRIQETVKGPELRDWSQKVGMLEAKQDFADRRQRGAQITVRGARTFLLNYHRGRGLRAQDFAQTETIPVLCKSGKLDPEWEKLRGKKGLWKDHELQQAGEAFAALIKAQREAFASEKKDGKNADYQEKALSYPIIASWALIAGLLSNNPVRLARHYELPKHKGRDPLNAAVLATAHHKSDPLNYRGLGTRTSPKDLGRLVELFWLQAEHGKGVSKSEVDLAMKSYHAKEAVLDLRKAKEENEQ